MIPDERSANLAVWAVLFAGAAGWQLTSACLRLPTLATVVQSLRRRRATRWPLLGAWAWLGWHLFVRTVF